MRMVAREQRLADELRRAHALVLAALIDVENVEHDVQRWSSPDLEHAALLAREQLAELETLLGRAVKGARDG